MVINFSQELADLEGKPLKEQAGVDTVREALLAAGVSQMMLGQALAVLRPFWSSGEPEVRHLTAARACANALQAEQNLPGAERVDRMKLAIKIMDIKPAEISEVEKAKILSAIEKTYPTPIVYFRVHQLFNGKDGG